MGELVHSNGGQRSGARAARCSRAHRLRYVVDLRHADRVPDIDASVSTERRAIVTHTWHHVRWREA